MQGRFEEALQEYEAGDEVKVTFFRRNQLHEKTLKLEQAPATDASIEPVDAPTAQQKARFLQWLQIPHPNA